MRDRSPITTHVLNTAAGRPGAGIEVTLWGRLSTSDGWTQVGTTTTDADGRASDLLAPGTLSQQHYRLTFMIGEYFEAQGIASLYPEISIDFSVANASEHYHIPLLVGPFSFTTYRGS